MRKLLGAFAGNLRNSRCVDNFLWLSLVLGLVCCPPLVFAGGIEIEKRSLAFDNDPTKRQFVPDIEIVMNYGYTAWAYGGKLHECIVFELRPVAVQGTASQVYFFVTEIHAVHGYGIARFSLPIPNRTYQISYHVAAFFSHAPLRASLHGGLVTFAEDKAAIVKFYQANFSGTESLAEIRSLSAGLVTNNLDMMTIYFKPGLMQEIAKTIAEKLPPTFEWRKGPDSGPGIQNEEYSYRLDPLEDWSHYSSATKATYYLLTPGDYVFEVRARYTINGGHKETAIASLPIQVKSVISAPPPLESLVKGDKVSPQFWDTHRYPHSFALLIAVSEYDDPAFVALPYGKSDVKLIARTLQERGFTTEKVESGTTRAGVERAMNGLLDKVTQGDAVILYFSGHGTFRGLSNFLVPTDCNSQKKEETCISYDWLKGWIDKVMQEKGAQHLLVILDACQAGLGLYSKSDSRMPLEALAEYPGAHMMTAGLMEQDAHVDLHDGVSVFTEYLAKGLDGAADWNGDKVITLSELLAYVQDRVSKHVYEKFNESQVPVMGKVKGAGEMLFRMP